MGLAHWSDAQQQGVSFYVAADGQLRLRHRGLTAEALEDLKAHRAVIVAEWLWTQEVPPTLRWDPAIADAVLRYTAWCLAGPALPSDMDWSRIERAQTAVDAAWRDQQLPRFVQACQQWVLTVVECQAAGETRDRVS